MKPVFHASLVNDPFDDPSVYVDIQWERRGLLFDLGANYGLAPRKLLKVSDAFVSHAHVDHFIGFDHLLRHRLARKQPLRLFGPPGMIERAAGKLSGYTWNLLDGYAFALEVAEIGEGSLRRARMAAGDGFRPALLSEETVGGPPVRILDEPLFRVEATLLDHRTPCAGYVLEEKLHLNINRPALERLGLPVGGWLRTLKQKIRAGESDETLIEIPGGRSLPLGDLRAAVVSATRGQKIAYVVDCGFSEENIRRIVDLARGADLFFCEAPFLEQDAERARDRYHLTARQAGWLAREAGAKRLQVLHFSPRYEGNAESLLREADEAFRGVDGQSVVR